MLETDKILDYWFGNDSDDLNVIKARGTLWFGKDERVDRYICQQFAPLLDRDWERSSMTVRQGLAQVVLFDQFTRNIFRGQAEAFAYDPIALQLVADGLDANVDRQLRPVERVFYYLPLEHSENLENQNRCVALYQRLAAEVLTDWQEAFNGFVDYAIRHQVIIERFGRFPHRNAILGRESTAEETAFLAQPGSSF